MFAAHSFELADNDEHFLPAHLVPALFIDDDEDDDDAVTFYRPAPPTVAAMAPAPATAFQSVSGSLSDQLISIASQRWGAVCQKVQPPDYTLPPPQNVPPPPNSNIIKKVPPRESKRVRDLVECVKQSQAKSGLTQVKRSMVALFVRQLPYEADFKDIVQEAIDAGAVEAGGTYGNAWIALTTRQSSARQQPLHNGRPDRIFM